MVRRKLNQANLQEEELVRQYFIKDVIKTIFVSALIFAFQAVLFFFWLK